jgi:glycyl-tRNA synthetase alpha chain
MFAAFEQEAWKLIKDHGHYLSGYEQALKMSHTFNILDARGAVSTTERPGIIKRIRDLTCACARAHVEREQAMLAPAQGKAVQA